MAHKWHTLAHNGPRIKNSSFDSARPAPTPYGVLAMDMEIQRHGNTALRWKTSRAAAFDLVCAQLSPKVRTVTPRRPIPHSALPTPNSTGPQSQRVDSSLRPTTETAEAGKGRGPRFSSGRRSRANPKITKNHQNQTNHSSRQPAAPFHTPHSQLQIPPPPSPQSQRVDSSLRPTTETAEAGKGRGPRFSSGRRSRAIPPPVIPAPTRHSGESRNPRTQTNHSSDTPALDTPRRLRQPKRERDVDPDFHRGDGVGPPLQPVIPAPTRHSGESRNPRTQTNHSSDTPALDTPRRLRQPKRERDVDPDFHRGDGVGPPLQPVIPPPPVIPAKAGIHVPKRITVQTRHPRP